ncbi:uncharacterized protein E5676_scaffold352G007170 [Cucumis melo var. makuwa]|uniref:Uncharacterized protein n=1 Tax=Cucumis melo var. makuwa TaxID=1194695 RepID=A0A5D3DPI1_CUCMM|nr:uncharacterized protein E6C27_scaffold135G002270 [Cucumis melo var. makuwa]TYK25563.1 uncharacterized protein E5676_scaffold352G007170 [Cucumis melo var. makuwa]
MLYLVEVFDSIRFLESRLGEIFEKADIIDVVAGRLKGLLIQKSLARVDTLKGKVGQTDVNTRLNLTMRAMTNQAPTGGAIPVSEVKILEPMPFCGARDAKALENFIFDLEQYFKILGNTLKKELRSQFYPENMEIRVRQKLCELKHTDHIRDAQDVRRHQNSSLGRNKNSSPSSSKVIERDKRPSGDRRPYQPNTGNTWLGPNNQNSSNRSLSCFIYSDDKSSEAEGEVDQTEEGENPRIRTIKFQSSLQEKAVETRVPVERGLVYVDTWINQKPTKSTMVDSGATHNFITEIEARRLRLHWEKDSGRIKAMNSVSLPIVGLVK